MDGFKLADGIQVVKDAKLRPEGCNICIIEPAAPGAAKRDSQESRPSQGSRPASFDATSAAIKHRNFIAQVWLHVLSNHAHQQDSSNTQAWRWQKPVLSVMKGLRQDQRRYMGACGHLSCKQQQSLQKFCLAVSIASLGRA